MCYMSRLRVGQGSGGPLGPLTWRRLRPGVHGTCPATPLPPRVHTTAPQGISKMHAPAAGHQPSADAPAEHVPLGGAGARSCCTHGAPTCWSPEPAPACRRPRYIAGRASCRAAQAPEHDIGRAECSSTTAASEASRKSILAQRRKGRRARGAGPVQVQSFGPKDTAWLGAAPRRNCPGALGPITLGEAHGGLFV